jgi:peroxiredoxin (alkyl hydroperoxide reductase subunit C)
MAIQVGDKIPAVGLMTMGGDGPEPVDTAKYFAGRKVVVFSVPGAFTPTCSAKHLPGFIDKIDAIKGKGVDAVACLAVNDPFVMGAWAKDQGAEGKVDMLADGSAKFTTALGLEMDLIERGLGMRGQRFAMVVEDGTVTHLAVEEPGDFSVSSADAVIEAL